jgi:type IV fimbrial biogenesis protein FimT
LLDRKEGGNVLTPSIDRREAGVTLIELFIALAIFGILLGVAVPAFQTTTQNSRIRTGAESILNGLQLARAEAVRRNAAVQFTLAGTATTAWTVAVVNGAEIQSRAAGEGSSNVTNITLTPPGATQVIFSSQGRVVNPAASTTLNQIVVDVPDSVLASAESRQLRIDIGAGGQIRLCDPALSSPDPRACL